MPLFVRLPREQSSALEQLASTTGRAKQHLVSEMLADGLTVGHAEISRASAAEDVLTLEEAAALLKLPLETVRASASAGELPGRAFGEQWRFSRAGLLEWLAGSPSSCSGSRATTSVRPG